jgi:general stress protein 26
MRSEERSFLGRGMQLLQTSTMQGHDGRDTYGRRRLTSAERKELLDRPLVGIWSTLTSRGTIHSVPVHFAMAGSDLFVFTERSSEKCRNALRSGRATLCVQTTLDGNDRRYVMAEGRVDSRSPTLGDLHTLWERYGGFEESDVEEEDDGVILRLVPERWVAWSDAD